MTLISIAVYPQTAELKFRHIAGAQGLSNSTIECIFQDSRGFMWFGTRDGLNRYDGHQINVYAHDPQNLNSVSDNFIVAIAEDHAHNLWFGTENGLNRYNFKTNRFTRFYHDPGNIKSLSDDRVSCIYEDTHKNIWVSTFYQGMNLYNPGSGQFSHFKHSGLDASTISSDSVNTVIEDVKGTLWIATRNGLNKFNPQTRRFTCYKNLSDPKRISSNNIFLTIKEDRLGGIWLGTEDNGLSYFNTATGTFRQYTHDTRQASSLASNMIKSILIDSKGQLWVGNTNGGLDFFDRKTQTFIHNQNTPDNQASLSQKTVSAIFEDNQTNLWVGTHRGGLNLYTPGATKFALYQHGTSPRSLGYYDVTAFCQDSRNRIWIGTDYGGIDLFNQPQQTFTHFRNDPNIANSLSSNSVLDIMEDTKSRMWISTWDGGLDLFDREKNSFTRFLNMPSDKYSISSDHVQKTFQDSRGNLWVATYYGGLNLLDPRNYHFQRIRNDPSGRTKIYGNNIVSINEDKRHNLWIGTDDGGLNCYNPSTEHYSHYFSEGKKPDIRVIFPDSKGRLWIGQNGLYLYDYLKKTFAVYTNKAGLGSLMIKAILEDKSHNLWISTSNGLIKFNPDTFAFKLFNKEDGLQDMEFEAGSALKTRDGEMFLGGGKGFNTFYADKIRNNTFIPPVYITDLQILNVSQIPGSPGSPLKYDISSTSSIELSHLQSTFSFTFAALNFTAPANNKYSYQLEGFDTHWIDAGNEQKAIYTNLDAGEYIFRVRASNNDGLWNRKGAMISITILPPFWAAWWFRTIAGALVLFLSCIWYEAKRKRSLKDMEENKREEMHQVQLQFFTNISHEFRTPLSLILGPLEALRKENKQVESAHYYHTIHRNANRLLNLINELMDFRKVESGVLKLKVLPGNLNFFLREIVEDFNDLSAQKQIEFSVSKEADFDQVWFDKQILEKIILNLLNNSFKYTPATGKISLDAFSTLDEFVPSFANCLIIKNELRSDAYFYIRVADNGIGISKESIAHLFERYYKITATHLGSGVGLAFVKSLTQLHKGDIYVYSERNIGTEIIIGLPMGKANYHPREFSLQDLNEIPVKLESLNSGSEQLSEFPFLDSQPAISGSFDKKNESILLVDDNEELRFFFRQSLSAYYNISEAANGKAGLESARHKCPDLIISDLMMPVMDGLEFCRAVKEDIHISHIPFILLTARDALSSKIEGIESGADIYFSKPASMELLLATIRNLFDKRQKIRDFYHKNYYSDVRTLVNTAKDEEFMNSLIAVINSRLTDPEFDVEYLCSELCMSRTKLYQKIKGLTDQSIVEFIRSHRLKMAIHIMTNEDVSINEILYRIGIQTHSYFTRSFKKEFGRTPSQFLQELQKQF